MPISDSQTELYHIKRLTADESYWPYHVHLDSRTVVPEPAAVKLRELGFARSLVAISCIAVAGQCPNSDVTQRMYDGCEPDNWTLKTDSLHACTRAFRGACELMEQYSIEGYAEAETVHRDFAVTTASKPFDHTQYDRLFPRSRDCELGGSTFVDSEGIERHLPFVIHQRSLDPALQETAPVFEFHLTLNSNSVRAAELWRLLSAIGLTSYEVSKIGVFPDGSVLVDEHGQPEIIVERPLTLRLSRPGRSSTGRTDGLAEFLGIARSVLDILSAVGGADAPRCYPTGCVLHPISFKIESLHGFFATVPHVSLLPPVLGGIEGGGALPTAVGLRPFCTELSNYGDRSYPRTYA